MRLYELGEDELIERLVRRFQLGQQVQGIVVGVGDDAAVLDLKGSEGYLIITTDMLSERVDFLLDRVTPYQLGWKSVAVNISDIAAMGGIPTWTLISIGLRDTTPVSFVDDLYNGMTKCARKFNSFVIGGDTNSVRGDAVISVCQMGFVEPHHVAVRSGARVGDKILVTGWLGNSRAGLELLLKLGLDKAAQLHANLVESHLMPMPRVYEARAAVKTGKVHAMMDLSDGLGSDLRKLCKASKVGAKIYADRLPISDDLVKAAASLGEDAVRLATSGGEDFELLIVTGEADVDTVKSAVETETGTLVTEIGEMVSEGIELIHPNGSSELLRDGWEHFRVK